MINKHKRCNMHALEAKIVREAQDHPTDWIIVPDRSTLFRLVQIAGFSRKVEGTDCTLEELRELGYGLMP